MSEIKTEARKHEGRSHSQRLEHQDNVGEVGALDLRHSVIRQLVLEAPGRVETEALARLRAPCAPGSLRRRRLAYRHDLQRLHARPRVVAVLFCEPCARERGRVGVLWVVYLDEGNEEHEAHLCR